jgi:hypothetical protein
MGTLALVAADGGPAELLIAPAAGGVLRILASTPRLCVHSEKGAFRHNRVALVPNGET